MSAICTLQVDEIDELSKTIRGMSLDTHERTYLLKSLGVEMEVQTSERFEKKVTPEGKEWKELSESTKRWYAKKYHGTSDPGRGLLFRTGGLHDSLESQVHGWSVLMGATKEYAAVHQWGRGGIPARQYLGVGREDTVELLSILNDFIAMRVKV